MRLLFEIGMEELPARFLKQALSDLKSNLETKLNNERIKFDEIKTYGTPRLNGKYANEILAKDVEDKGRGTDDTKYEVYLLSTIGVNYQATPNVTLYAHVGGEYRNWTIESDNSASQNINMIQ